MAGDADAGTRELTYIVGRVGDDLDGAGGDAEAEGESQHRGPHTVRLALVVGLLVVTALGCLVGCSPCNRWRRIPERCNEKRSSPLPGTIGDGAPTDSASSIRVSMPKIDGRWLISEFTPV